MNANSGVAGYTSSERRSVLISCAFGFGIDFYVLLIIAFLLHPIEKSLGIDLKQAGVVISMTLVGSIGGGIFFGWLGDKIGRKPTLLWTLLLFALGSVLCGFAWNYESLLWFRFLTGLGLGGEWALGMALFNEVWNPKRRGLGSAVIQASAAVGVALSSTIAIWALTTFGPAEGWRITFWSGGVPVLLMIYVRWFMPESKLWSQYEGLRRSGELPAEKKAETASVFEVFRGASCKYTILGALAVGGSFFAYQCAVIFTPKLILSELSAHLDTVRAMMLMFALVSGLGIIIAGWFSDRFGRKWAAIAPNLCSIFAFILMFIAAREHDKFPGSIWHWMYFYGFMLFALGVSAQGIFGSWFSELFPVELRSAGSANAYNIGRGIAAIAPALVPVVALSVGGGLMNGMMIGLAGTAVFVVAALFLPETAGRQFAVIEGKERSELELQAATAQAN